MIGRWGLKDTFNLRLGFQCKYQKILGGRI